MKELLLYLVSHKYSGQLKGKSWWCLLELMDGLESTNRYFKCSFEVVFTPEMVESLEILPDNRVIIKLIH